MSENLPAQRAGWSIGSSIAMELDTVISVLQGYFAFVTLPEPFALLMQNLPADVTQELLDILGESKRLSARFEHSAYLAGTLLEDDYRSATLPIRQMTTTSALDNLIALAEPLDLTPDNDLPPTERLIDLFVKLRIAAHARVSTEAESRERFTGRVRGEIEQVLHILHDGDQHARFWLWLDRFYYEFYRPWRELHIDKLASMEKRALTIMGQEHAGETPAIHWLPRQNPVRMHPSLQQAVTNGELHLVLWVEPFELSDTWTLLPDTLIVSFAEPGPMWDNFTTTATDVADRAKALADPTRLVILRLIRNFSLINTDIAEYLDLARPTVSVHAKILREAGLIRSHKEGRRIRHEIVPEEVNRLFRDLQDFLDLSEEEH